MIPQGGDLHLEIPEPCGRPSGRTSIRRKTDLHTMGLWLAHIYIYVYIYIYMYICIYVYVYINICT